MAEKESENGGEQIESQSRPWGERNISEYLPGQSYSPELVNERNRLREQLDGLENRLREIDRQFAELKNTPNDYSRTRREQELEARYNQINDYRGSVRSELQQASEGMDSVGWKRTAEEDGPTEDYPEDNLEKSVYEGATELLAVSEPEIAEVKELDTPPRDDITGPATTTIGLRGAKPTELAVPESVAKPTPEKVNDYYRRAIDEINSLCLEQNSIAQDRFRGLLGPARRWFDSVGDRRQATTLEKAGEWKDNAKWKKWAKIGLKVGGVFGLAAAMTFTGGAGAILTPLLWTMGAREGIDGTLQLAERSGWGGKRARVELETQRKLTQEVEALKGLIKERGKELSETEYVQAAQRMVEAAGKTTEQQMGNMRSERRWALFRSITSTILSIGAGAVAGVPLGTANYTTEATGHATQVGQTSLYSAHQVFINYRGGQFLYDSPSEMMRVAAEVSKHGYDWTVNSESLLRASHVLGHGLPLAEKVGLGLSGAYLIGRMLESFVGRKKDGKEPKPTPYSPYSPYSPDRPYSPRPPYSPYSPKSPYSPYREGGLSSTETGGNPEANTELLISEKERVESYLNQQDGEYLKELEAFSGQIPAMDEGCRMAVCIPVACTETDRIYSTLEKYLGQTDTP